MVDEPTVVDEAVAFAAWYRNEHPRLLATMTIVTRDLHVAQDVTAEAFARALAAWKRVSAMDSPTGWTYRVAVNLARRRARRATIEERLLRRMPPPTASSEATASRPSARSSCGTRCGRFPLAPAPR